MSSSIVSIVWKYHEMVGNIKTGLLEPSGTLVHARLSGWPWWSSWRKHFAWHGLWQAGSWNETGAFVRIVWICDLWPKSHFGSDNGTAGIEEFWSAQLPQMSQHIPYHALAAYWSLFGCWFSFSDVLRAFSSCRLVHVDFDCLFGKGAQAATVVHGSQ